MGREEGSVGRQMEHPRVRGLVGKEGQLCRSSSR